jgi:ribosomal protein S18 acetylase RimI-like enzyme
MKARKYQEKDSESLFAYWQRLGEKIPYFFPVTSGKWHECMFEDKLDNEKKFLFQETFVAEENGQIVGFIQYGQPAIAWDEQGQKYQNPQIGIIRHFYFEADRFDVANLLYAQCENYLKQFSGQHAFYHIFGVSCNAHHGKLHESLDHVNRFLIEKGYRLEHENQYYSLELQEDQVANHTENELRLVPKPVPQPSLGEYEICLHESPIGMIQIRYLEMLTGGATANIVYMTWIGINEAFRRQGWGSKAMELLIATLHSKGYKQLHLDTASTNETAQQFYEHYGFESRGRTRSFIKTII